MVMERSINTSSKEQFTQSIYDSQVHKRSQKRGISMNVTIAQPDEVTLGYGQSPESNMELKRLQRNTTSLSIEKQSSVEGANNTTGKKKLFFNPRFFDTRFDKKGNLVSDKKVQPLLSHSRNNGSAVKSSQTVQPSHGSPDAKNNTASRSKIPLKTKSNGFQGSDSK